ncbi:hypothetical protein HYW75_04755 [Candidatus Pacearchaeota archaeon]|nr:hypothetical protein [Candidatus Pacearchaeota archaeon]
MTSGHASNRDWHPGFNYPDDVFILNDKGEIEVKTQDGLIRGKVNSQNPKVYYAPGNCRIAQIKSPNEAIVLSWLQSGGVTQYFGYLIDTWHGVSGWGMAQHLLASDRPTFFEAHHMNCLAIQFLQEQIADYRVRNNLGKGEEEYGKVYDKNIFVGYGDPALEVRIGKSTEPFYEKEMKIEEVRETKYNLKVKIIRDNTSLSTPIVFLLPKKAVSPRVTGAPNFSYKIGDNFAILDVGHDIFNENNAPRLRPRELKKGSEWTLEFYTKPGN